MNNFKSYVDEQLSDVIVDAQLASDVRNTIWDYEKSGVVKYINLGRRGIRPIHRKSMVSVALLCILVLTFTLVTPLHALAKNLVTYCYYVAVNGQEIQMATDGIPIPEQASHERKVYNTLEEAEKDLGIRLLKSPMAYEEADAVNEYSPQVSEDGVLYGIMIQNHGYVTGDLTNVSVRQQGKPETHSYAYTFTSSKDYLGPIGCQIEILSKEASKYDTENKEMYSGGRFSLLGSMAENAEVYISPNLGCKVLILTAKTDGIMVWAGNGVIDGETKFDQTTAELVYGNITYMYYGFVSKDTMKEMIESLSY